MISLISRILRQKSFKLVNTDFLADYMSHREHRTYKGELVAFIVVEGVTLIYYLNHAAVMKKTDVGSFIFEFEAEVNFRLTVFLSHWIANNSSAFIAEGCKKGIGFIPAAFALVVPCEDTQDVPPGFYRTLEENFKSANTTVVGVSPIWRLKVDSNGQGVPADEFRQSLYRNPSLSFFVE